MVGALFFIETLAFFKIRSLLRGNTVISGLDVRARDSPALLSVGIQKPPLRC